MAEFIGEEKLVRENEPIVFENKTDSSFDVGMGVVFHKSGTYEVSIVGNKTTVSEIGKPKTGRFIHWVERTEEPFSVMFTPHCKCSICGTEFLIRGINYCYACGAKMVKEGE